jgi:hypothetical protein
MLHVLAISFLINSSYGIRKTAWTVEFLTAQFYLLILLWHTFYSGVLLKLNILPQSQNILFLALRRLSRTIFSRSSLVATSLRLAMVDCSFSISAAFSFSFCFCLSTVCCHRFRSSHLATSSADWNYHHNMFPLINIQKKLIKYSVSTSKPKIWSTSNFSCNIWTYNWQSP